MLGRATAVMGQRLISLKTNIYEIIPFFTRKGADLTENARRHISKKATHYHWNQCHKTTSGQQMLPKATAAMGIMMRPWANTNSIRLGTEA